MTAKGVIAVTGATGFLGRALVPALADRQVRLFGRGVQTMNRQAVLPLDDLASLAGVSCVVHLAGIPTSRAPEDELMRVNVDLAAQMARAAAARGVERFILFSSLHVHGKAAGRKLMPGSPFAPHNAYGLSKVLAEETVGRICRDSGLQLVVLRPPMVYGMGGRGSFFQLLKLVRMGLPLPFGGARAPRSFCAMANLVSATLAAVDHPAPPAVILPADPNDFSTRDLILAMKAACLSKSMLLPVPANLMKCLMTALGHAEMAQSLFEPLQIDRGHWNEWGWQPIMSGLDGVRATVDWI